MKISEIRLADLIGQTRLGQIWLSDVTSAVRAQPRSNLSASAPPGAANDQSQGYSVGSLWADTSADEGYLCLDASSGAAVWKQIT